MLAFPDVDGRDRGPVSQGDWGGKWDHVVLQRLADLHVTVRLWSAQRVPILTVLGIDGFILNISLITASRYGSSSICSNGRASPYAKHSARRRDWTSGLSARSRRPHAIVPLRDCQLQVADLKRRGKKEAPDSRGGVRSGKDEGRELPCDFGIVHLLLGSDAWSHVRAHWCRCQIALLGSRRSDSHMSVRRSRLSDRLPSWISRFRSSTLSRARASRGNIAASTLLEFSVGCSRYKVIKSL